MTLQQIIILALVAILGLTALSLIASRLFSHPTAAQNTGGQPATKLPATTAPAAEAASTVIATSTNAALLPAGATDCVKTLPISTGTVTLVTDSGTIEVQMDGTSQEISFAGIVIPPIVTNDSQAEQMIRDMLLNKSVWLAKDVSAQDSAGRAPRYIITGDGIINAALVRQGLATVQANSPNQACAAVLEQAEQQARASRLGIWNLTPVPTRTFMPMVSLAPATEVAGCDCSKRPICADFKTHAAAQACYNACQDYNTKLDDNHDGIACENLP